MSVLRIVCGGVLGLLAGGMFGFVGAAWRSTSESPVRQAGQSAGWDPISLMHTPSFWAPVLLCALAFAWLFGYLFGRAGRSKQHVSM